MKQLIRKILLRLMAWRLTKTILVKVDTHIYRFRLALVAPEVVRIYILQMPAYGVRSSDLQSTHRFASGGKTWICIKDEYTPRTFEEAEGWANYWAKMNSRYITTGEAFS